MMSSSLKMTGWAKYTYVLIPYLTSSIFAKEGLAMFSDSESALHVLLSTTKVETLMLSTSGRKPITLLSISGLSTKIVQLEKETRLFNSLRVTLKMSVVFLQFWIVFRACKSRSILFESSKVEIWFVKLDCFDLIEL